MIYFDNMGKLSISPEDKMVFLGPFTTMENVVDAIRNGAVIINPDHICYMKAKEMPDELE